MAVRAAWLLPLLALLMSQPPAPDAGKKDLARMQGTWVMAALEVNGQDVGVDKVQGTTLTVKDHRYTVKAKGKERGCVIRLDPKQNPPAIDMIFTEPGGVEKTFKGIYKIEGETLRIGRGLGAEQARPGQLATWPGTNYFVVTWKKQ